MFPCFADEALKILKSATSQANSILTETHPLQGELADATARVYATTGQNNSLIYHTVRICFFLQKFYIYDNVKYVKVV